MTDFLGAAAFSRAVQATDIQTGSLVCLKIIKNNKDYLDQSLDEIKLLKYVNDADPSDEHGIVRLYDFFYYKVRGAGAGAGAALVLHVAAAAKAPALGLLRGARPSAGERPGAVVHSPPAASPPCQPASPPARRPPTAAQEHLFLVCELLRANLYEFQKYNRESGDEVYFTLGRIQSIARQVLRSLAFLHSLGLIHSDLKPENILIRSYSRCAAALLHCSTGAGALGRALGPPGRAPSCQTAARRLPSQPVLTAAG